MSDNEKESARAKRIGGSEVAAIFHEHPFLDEFGLWAKKKGGLPPESPDIRMQIGKILERPLMEIYTLETGNKTEWCDQPTRHPDYPFMVYSPDAYVVDVKIGIDAKVVFRDQAWNWGYTADEIPPHTVMQAEWYMAATGYPEWHIIALVAGEVRIYQIRHDPEFAADILKKAEWWWRRYIMGDERPPITPSDHAKRWLHHHYPKVERDIQRASEAEAELLDRYSHVREQALEFDANRRTLEGEIKAAIGDREGLKWPGGIFTWKATKDKIKTDWETLAQALLKDNKSREQLIKKFSYVQAGERRMWFAQNTKRKIQEREEYITHGAE